MNENEFSCIKQVTKTVHLTMPLKYISNEIAGVTEILDGWKRQYVPKLQGVVVNYRNIRLSSRSLFIHISRTAPRYDVTATFDVFCPSIGDIVKGKINRTSREHIGCLIEGTINATIHLPIKLSPKLAKFKRINHDILFQINRFEFNRHTIRVNGKITRECVKLMEELFPDVKDEVPENISNGLSNSLLNFDNHGNSSSSSSSDECKNFTSTLDKTYKAKSPISIKEEIESENDLLGNTSTHSPKLKISKKRKRDSESSISSSSTHSKKRKKLKQSESALENETLISDASEPLTSKKKKKQKDKSVLIDDLISTMLNKASEFDPISCIDALQQIKREIVSPTNSTMENERRGQKRKHESISSDVNESDHEKKKSKDRKKLKASKMKGKLVASGDILKKDKKSKSHKHSSKKKRSDEKTVSKNVPVEIKTELN